MISLRMSLNLAGEEWDGEGWVSRRRAVPRRRLAGGGHSALCGRPGTGLHHNTLCQVTGGGAAGAVRGEGRGVSRAATPLLAPPPLIGLSLEQPEPEVAVCRPAVVHRGPDAEPARRRGRELDDRHVVVRTVLGHDRSEERRVGKECRSRRAT